MRGENIGGILVCVVGLLWPIGALHSQVPQFVHPPQPPAASDFAQPPENAKTHWRGPAIGGFNVRCWSAEPSEPTQFVGGVHGIQNVTAFVSTSELMDSGGLDTSFRQTTLASFSGGGMASEVNPRDLPAGFFMSFKGHPAFKVKEVKYPASSLELPRMTPSTGVMVVVDFLHEPRMGECGLYMAIWSAVK
jgi:hypothetical protein